jgi:hypothetical protein
VRLDTEQVDDCKMPGIVEVRPPVGFGQPQFDTVLPQNQGKVKELLTVERARSHPR